MSCWVTEREVTRSLVADVLSSTEIFFVQSHGDEWGGKMLSGWPVPLLMQKRCTSGCARDWMVMTDFDCVMRKVGGGECRSSLN